MKDTKTDKFKTAIAKPMLNTSEQKLQNETGCKYGMRDCLYRMVHSKCFKCKERSEYEWDYTIGTV